MFAYLFKATKRISLYYRCCFKFCNSVLQEIEKLLEEHNRNLERIKIEKECENRRVEAEWQDKITATVSQHKDILESAIAQHDVKLHQLRAQFCKEVCSVIYLLNYV